MPSPTDRYKDLFKNILDELMGESEFMDDILRPMRVYINDMEGFRSPASFLATFRTFLQERDERLTEAYLKKHNLEDPAAAHQLQEAINKILTQALFILEEADKNQVLESKLKTVIEKIRDAKTLNNLRQLQDVMIEAGEEMISYNEEFKSSIAKMSSELAVCQHHIYELENRLEQNRDAAENDHLTGLLNRRMFDTHLLDSVARAKRFHTPLSMMLLDLDHFKEINDKWGHSVGDDVLTNFAKLLKDSLRGFDLTFRIGGDEFGVLFTNCDLEKATRAAKRVCAFVSERPYRLERRSFRMSLSGGVALCSTSEDAKTFFRRVDKYLYEAKKKGRNTIVSELEDSV